MKKIVFVLLAMVMLIAVPCLAFDGYQGHEGQIPVCQNKKTGALRFAPMKDVDPTIKGVDYEPYCSTTTETMIWMSIQGTQGPKGDTGPQGPTGKGVLGVYDGGGLFLGYLLEINAFFIPYGPGEPIPGYTLYNPDVPGFFMVRLENPPSLAAKIFGARYFTTEDCSGQLYLLMSSEANQTYGWHDLFTLFPSTNDFYTIDTQVPPVRWSDLKRAKGRPDDVCQNTLVYSPDRVAFAIKPVGGPIPLFNETLQYPIVLQPVN